MVARKIARREWTRSDVRELKSMAKKVPARQIARKLRRSEGAVRQKAFVLGTSLGTRGIAGGSDSREVSGVMMAGGDNLCRLSSC